MSFITHGMYATTDDWVKLWNECYRWFVFREWISQSNITSKAKP